VSRPDPTTPAHGVAPWLPFVRPRDAHRAASRAVLHAPTGCRLVELWFASDGIAGAGTRQWHVIAPNGWSREVCAGEPADLLDLAEAAIRKLLREIEGMQQLGG
jgi:hypothetical protein